MAVSKRIKNIAKKELADKKTSPQNKKIAKDLLKFPTSKK